MRRKLSIPLKALMTMVSASIAMNPLYGIPAHRIPTVDTTSTTSGWNTVDSGFGDPFGADPKSQIESQEDSPVNFRKKLGICRPKIGAKLPKDSLLKETLSAPILKDIGPCDEEKVTRCLNMLSRSITDSQQALVGFDETRDKNLENGTSLRYMKTDVLTIQSILKSWNQTKIQLVGKKNDQSKPDKAAVDENRVQEILDRAYLSGSDSIGFADSDEISKIHLALSEELVVASEASLDAYFSDFSSARALLASVNPSASAAFACLVSFKKSDTTVQIQKEKIVVGYFSGTKYATINESSRANGGAIAIWVALIALGGVIVDKIFDTVNETRKIAAEKEEREKDRAHDSAEKAKDRALEREKEKLPPEPKTDKKPEPKTPPVVEKQTPKPKEDDMFKPFPGSDDYDPDGNKHYDNQYFGCESNLDGLDSSNPRLNPDLVRDYAEPIWSGDGNDDRASSLNIDERDTYSTYLNPMDMDRDSGAVLSLEDFRKPSVQLSEQCHQIKTAN